MGLSRKTLVREWIVLALCLGLGAHVALGFLLHGEQGWPIESYGYYGIFFGVFIYVVVQIGRSIWWVRKENRSTQSL
jgi:hypothetical protein